MGEPRSEVKDDLIGRDAKLLERQMTRDAYESGITDHT
jgi:hypothetical protein